MTPKTETTSNSNLHSVNSDFTLFEQIEKMNGALDRFSFMLERQTETLNIFADLLSPNNSNHNENLIIPARIFDNNNNKSNNNNNINHSKCINGVTTKTLIMKKTRRAIMKMIKIKMTK